MKGYIHSVETFGAVDGPGIRFVVFMQGCPLRCIFCHNPDTWKMRDGEKRSVSSLVRQILPYKNYIKSGGVTLSGGEPLLQSKFTLKLINQLHKHKIKVAIDTAGSVYNKDTKKIIERADLILLDIKSLNNVQNKQITGQSNENNIAILNYCENIKKRVWIRQVLLPNYTLNVSYLKGLAEFLKNYHCIETIDLIPFHKMGEYKWKNLNLDYILYNTKEPTQEEIKKAKQIFKDFNLPILE